MRKTPRRKVITGALLAAGSVVASVLVRRRAARKVERIDLYSDDGSMLSFADGSPEAIRLLPLAREILAD